MTDNSMMQDNEQFLLVDTDTQTIEQEDVAIAVTHDDDEDGMTTKKTVTTDEIPLENIDYDALRAGIISITTYRPDGVPLGLVFQEEEEEEDIELDEARIVLTSIARDHEDGEDFFCFPSNAPIQVGDYLEKVNNQAVAGWYLDDVMELLDSPGLLTLTFATPRGNPSLVQAFVVKPSPESPLGIIINSINGEPNIFVQGIVSADESEEEMTEDSPSLPPLLQHAVLKPNDVLLSVNGTILQDNDNCKEPNQVAQMLRDAPYDVTIVAVRPLSWHQKLANGIRKSAVGAAGGTMVGVGLVFIPTLPPPFGELLIVGGVSLLGTEFEAPKQVMKQARDSLKDAVGTEETMLEEEEAGKEPEDFVLVSDDDVSTDEAAMKKLKEKYTGSARAAAADGATTKTSMKSKVKKFGRRFVLPILDQVVGDNPTSTKVQN